MLRFAIIGAGRIGAVHARSITAHSGAELVLVADPDGAAAAAIAAAAGPDVRHTTTIDDVFTDDAIDAVAEIAVHVNATVENIGARRLQTVLERILDDISFSAPDRSGETLTVDGAAVRTAVGDLARNTDLSRFIL